MTSRIDYANVSPAGYKTLGGIYALTFRIATFRKNSFILCICAFRRSMAAHIASICILAICSSPAFLSTSSYWYQCGAKLANYFSNRERIALAWAETVTRVAETGVPDADYDSVTSEFNDKELVDLTYAIGLINIFNRLSISFRTPPAAVIKARNVA